MNEDTFNMSIRKFLKTVGVTSQREIEQTARQAIADGRLQGNETLAITARVSIGDVALETEIPGKISLD